MYTDLLEKVAPNQRSRLTLALMDFSIAHWWIKNGESELSQEDLNNIRYEAGEAAARLRSAPYYVGFSILQDITSDPDRWIKDICSNLQ